MLADSLLPTTFWAEAVSTACYIFNRVRVTKHQNKTPYELLFGLKPIISYIRPFECHVTILDTLSVLGKFDGKSNEGFLVGYSLNSKAYRVYNLVTKRVEVNLHVNFHKDKPNVKGVGYRWMFDIDYLTNFMNYIPDIIFRSTKKSWCDEFEALMKSRFQMSSMGELTFFLGLQVKQNKGGIFISQDKYVAEILKKFNTVS
ncbi:retrovirus-related pol polyprotein from transposon TNT 1-94 [Tanacetum coccineum]